MDQDNARVDIFIDGSKIHSWVLAGRAKYDKCARSTAKDSGSVSRRLVFGPIELTGRFSAHVWHLQSIAIIIVIDVYAVAARCQMMITTSATPPKMWEKSKLLFIK